MVDDFEHDLSRIPATTEDAWPIPDKKKIAAASM
jgi:hypothetical protein